MRKAIVLAIIAILALTLLVSCGKKETAPAETPAAPEAALAQPTAPAAEPAKPAETAPTPAEATAPVDLGIDTSDLDIGDNPDYGMDDDVDMSVEE